jgi:hypothetical protein
LGYDATFTPVVTGLAANGVITGLPAARRRPRDGVAMSGG